MRQERIGLLVLLAAGQVWAQSGNLATGVGTRPIFAAPAIDWDSAMLTSRFASQQTATDFATLTGGLTFGMSPAALNTVLATPAAGLEWKTLTPASDYLEEVRYLALPLESAGALRTGLTACTGEHSSVLLLFRAAGLFRLSYRLAADEHCPDPSEAARQVLARYVPLQQTVASSVRYRTGRTEVVDITDPAAGALIPVRWRQGQR